MLNWPSRKSQLAEEAVKILFKRGAILFGEFTLTSGLKSPYYIDLRVIPSYPEDFDRICTMYAEIIENEFENVDKIAGVPTAGIPFAALVAYKLKKPLIYVRKEVERAHGRGKLVEGVLHRGERVVLIDDVATTGGSLILTAKSVHSFGGEVAGAVVLVDREQGATENLKKAGVELHYLIRISDAPKILLRNGMIDEETYEKMMKIVKRR